MLLAESRINDAAERQRFPILSTLDADALRSLLLANHEQLVYNNTEIEHLKLVIAKLRRTIFGTKSEQVVREIEQLGLSSKNWRPFVPSVSLPGASPLPKIQPGHHGADCPSTCRVECIPSCLLWKPVPTAAAS